MQTKKHKFIAPKKMSETYLDVFIPSSNVLIRIAS